MRNICIICAIPQETKHLLARFPQRSCGRLSSFRTWGINATDRTITIIESGIGRENAARAAIAAIMHNRPDCIINGGFCGAMTTGLHVGDIVTAGQIHNLRKETAGEAIPLDATSNNPLLTEFATADFITADFICSKDEILKSFSYLTTAVVEMESYGVASTCKEHGVPFIAVRAVSDPLDTDPSHLFRVISDKDFNISLPAVISAVIKKPSLLGQFVTLAKNARRAGKSLATAIVNIVETL